MSNSVTSISDIDEGLGGIKPEDTLYMDRHTKIIIGDCNRLYDRAEQERHHNYTVSILKY